jgi:hypothetical protein
MAGNGALKRVQKALDALAELGPPLPRMTPLGSSGRMWGGPCGGGPGREGATWTRIGALYGTSKRNAQQRFGARAHRTDSDAFD